jgi:hypothetical protein
MSRILGFTLLLTLPAVSSAADPAFISIEEKDGKLTVPLTKREQRMVPETVTVIENGRPVARTTTRTVIVSTLTQRVLDAELGDFFTPSGERIDVKKLNGVLKKGAVLAVSTDGKSVSPEAVKKNKDVVAILVPKESVVGKFDTPKKDLMDEKPFASEAWVKDGVVSILREVVVMEQSPKKETRGKGGKGESSTVQVPVVRREPVPLDPKLTQILRLDGREVPKSEWEALLKEKTKVIVSPGGKVVPDELQAANKDAVVVIVIKAK